MDKTVALFIFDGHACIQLISFMNLKGVKSGWGFVAKVKGKVDAKVNRAYKTITSSIRMEVEAVSRAFFLIREMSVHSCCVYHGFAEFASKD
jgi:ribonuclease HI